METIKNTTSRIHPLMAAAAVSVIVVSLAGTAAVTGLLPSSHGAPEAIPTNTALMAPGYGTTGMPVAAQGNAFQGAQQGVQPVQAAYGQAYAQPLAAAQPAPAPVVIEKTIIKEVPVHTKTTSHAHAVRHNTSYARNDGYYAPAPAPRPAQPNYVAIGTGAVIGGLVGNQVGSGNGRKLATVAGIIGGGMLGNQIANGR
jgi:uncharacterized protein YcfJ